jgi:hypothetical protein
MPDNVVQPFSRAPAPPAEASLPSILRDEIRREIAEAMRSSAAAPEPEPESGSSPLLKQFAVTVGAGLAVWAFTRALERRGKSNQ